MRKLLILALLLRAGSTTTRANTLTATCNVADPRDVGQLLINHKSQREAVAPRTLRPVSS